MPDLLAHYVAGLLISSRRYGVKRSLLIALTALLPDIDVLFGRHRSIAHSIVIPVVILIVIAVLIKFLKNRADFSGEGGFIHRVLGGLTLISLIVSLYATSVIMDLFTGGEPILWPLSGEIYQVISSVEAVNMNSGGLPLLEIKASLLIRIVINGKFHRGPLVSPLGMVVTIIAIAQLSMERIEEIKRMWKEAIRKFISLKNLMRRPQRTEISS